LPTGNYSGAARLPRAIDPLIGNFLAVLGTFCRAELRWVPPSPHVSTLGWLVRQLNRQSAAAGAAATTSRKIPIFQRLIGQLRGCDAVTWDFHA
jgi:hypothetical protein